MIGRAFRPSLGIKSKPKLIYPLTLALLLFALSTLHTAEKPNIILIYADDFGYTDIGAFAEALDDHGYRHALIGK